VIKIPITGLDPTISFGHVKVIGPEKLWYIRMEYNVLHFSLASTVNLSIDMQLDMKLWVGRKSIFPWNQSIGWLWEDRKD
jgi:hypothetical protein